MPAVNSVAHSLQFGSKYHVSSDSLGAQITEHTDRTYVMVALYYVGVKIRKFVTQREQTDIQTQTQRIQLQRPL